MVKIRLSVELAEEILDSNETGYEFEHEGRRYTQVDEEQFVAQGRWTITHMLIFEDTDGDMYGLEYMVGASDAQDDIEPFEYGAELVPVHAVTSTKWVAG